MKPVTFIHCADTHLGKIQHNSIRRFEDFLNSFDNLVDYAIANRVDFIIVAGDFFDKRNINPDTFSKTFGILKKLKKSNIKLIACEGNHDKTFYGNKLSWMETLAEIGYIILLKPDYSDTGNIRFTAWNKGSKSGFYYDVTDDIRIFGLGFLGPEANNRLLEIAPFLLETRENNKFNLLLLHGIIKKYESDFIGNISADAVNKLKNSCDYIALGHQHKRYEHENFAFNPGSLEYWDIEEVKHKSDEKGFYHLKINSGGKMKSLFKVSSKRPAIHLAINISKTGNPADVESLIISGLTEKIQEMQSEQNANNSPLIWVVLRGTIKYDVMEIDTKYLKEKINELFKPALVEVNTERIQFEGKSGNIISYGMDRKEIEREVIKDYVEQSARFGGQGDCIADLILGVMNLATTSGENDEEIYKMIVNCEAHKKDVELIIEAECEEEIEEECGGENKKGSGAEQKSMLDF